VNGSPAPPSLRGDESALYRALAPRLIALLRRRVGGPEQTREDACSFAWVQLLRRQPERLHVLGWLYVVACREAWRLLERDSRCLALPNEDLEAHAGAVLAVAAHQAMLETRDALAALPERQRKLLFLSAAGYTYADLAVLDRSSLTAVGRHLRGARPALRAEGGEKR